MHQKYASDIKVFHMLYKVIWQQRKFIILYEQQKKRELQKRFDQKDLNFESKKANFGSLIIGMRFWRMISKKLPKTFEVAFTVQNILSDFLVFMVGDDENSRKISYGTVLWTRVEKNLMIKR